MRHASNTPDRQTLWSFWSLCSRLCPILLLAGLNGCTTNSPHRFNLVDSTQASAFVHDAQGCREADPVRAGGEQGKPPGTAAPTPPFEVPFAQDRHPCYAHSVERNALYTLFFIEFDEQGRFYNPRQVQALIDHLQARQDGRTLPRRAGCRGGPGTGTGLSLVTFVHGWRHNARYDDGNVDLARAVLAQTHQGERHGAQYNPEMCPREVVGVYIGWRGLSLTGQEAPHPVRTLLSPLLELPTVWDRKNTAQNVAVGSVRELFSLLRTYQDRRNRSEHALCADTDTASGTLLAPAIYQCKAVRHLIVGHSFGALIVHNAISQQLIESISSGHFLPEPERSNPALACDVKNNGSDSGKAVVRGYADLVVLLNPAVEGARFEPLHEAVQRRRALRQPGLGSGFCPGQMPVYVTITSRHDDATRVGFNVVRFFATLFESNTPWDGNLSAEQRAFIAAEERTSSARALGHVARYQTHELRAWDDFMGRVLSPAPGKPAPGPLQTAVAQAIAQHCRDAGQDHQIPGCEDSAARAAPFYRRGVGSDGVPVLRLLDSLAPQVAVDDPRAVDVARINAAEGRRKTARHMTDEDRADDVQQCRKAAQTDLWLSAALLARNGGTAQPGDGWAVHALGGTVLAQQPVYDSGLVRETRATNAPLWNIHVQDRAVMSGHNAIEGQALLGFIAQLYRSVVIRSHEPEVLGDLSLVARCELAKCALAADERQQPCTR